MKHSKELDSVIWLRSASFTREQIEKTQVVISDFLLFILSGHDHLRVYLFPHLRGRVQVCVWVCLFVRVDFTFVSLFWTPGICQMEIYSLYDLQIHCFLVI